MTPITSAGRITHRELRIRGLRIHAQIQGEGEPLLMYSPIWSRAEVWAPLLPYLTGFRTIAFDPPGIGRSPMPTLPMTMQGLASVGAGLLDELGIESAHVLGASFGGAVAQHMAICHRGRVRRLVLASTSFGAFAIPGHTRALGTSSVPGVTAAGWRRSQVTRSGAACAPRQNSCAPCPSAARRTFRQPSTTWLRSLAGRACRGYGRSVSPRSSSAATTTRSRGR